MISRWRGRRKQIVRTRFVKVKRGQAAPVTQQETDPATGFLTRPAFRRVLDQVVDSAHTTSQTVGLCVFDLDDFRVLNDTHGVAAGDSYLKGLASTLVDFLPKGTVISRIGGDEFAVVLPGLEPSRAKPFGDDMARFLRDFAPTMDNRSLQLTASVGIAVFPEHALRASDLLLAAERALDEAKERGRARAQVVDPLQKSRDRTGILRNQLDRVREALANDRFIPVYQPIVDISSGRIVSVETLCRLREDDGRLVSPDQFMDAAERFGFVTDIDRRIIALAIEALVVNKKRIAPDLELSLNLSGLDFEDDSLVADISRLVRTKGIHPGRITFEITETAAVRDLKRVQNFIAALAAEGFRFALDDFGIGFSSFRYLREFPLGSVKFDQSYVRSLVTQEENRIFVRGIVSICKGLHIRTVAEGVETHDVVKILKELGVNRAQGYLFGFPSPTLPMPKP